MDKDINSTEKIKGGTTPGLGSTLDGMEQWDINKLNDPAGQNKEFNGPSSLGGKK